jgi:hypothetical protein
VEKALIIRAAEARTGEQRAENADSQARPGEGDEWAERVQFSVFFAPLSLSLSSYRCPGSAKKRKGKKKRRRNERNAKQFVGQFFFCLELSRNSLYAQNVSIPFRGSKRVRSERGGGPASSPVRSRRRDSGGEEENPASLLD